VKERLIISGIWLTAFILSLLIVESYVHTKSSEGLQILFPEDRLATMKPLMSIFGVYLGAILTFWFTKPFNPSASDTAEKVRFWLATLCTLVFVMVLLYFVAYTHLFGPGDVTVVENIITGTKVAALMSFIVAPINLYYFGMKYTGSSGQ